MSQKFSMKEVTEELNEITQHIYERFLKEMRVGEVSPERSLAVGIAAGAVMRARAELLQELSSQQKAWDGAPEGES